MKKTIAALGLLAFTASPAFADATNEDLMRALSDMKNQMGSMQSTIDRQNMRIQQLESSRVLETPQPSTAVPGTMSDADFQKSLKDNIGEAVSWMKGLKQSGDFRLRYESFNYTDKNNDNGSTGTSADRTRNRFRIRLRWGVEKDFGDDWKVGFRIATSGNSNTDPNSTNVTLGNPGYFNYKPIWVDRAYAVWEPNGFKDYGMIKGLKVGAGKFDNPFLRYSTTIVWDADVTPEGAFEQANLKLVSTEDTQVNLYGTAGQFIVNENAGNETDASIFGYQGALNVSTYAFNTEQPVDITGAVSFYDYTNWFQTVTSNTSTSATSYLRTNSIVADDFRVLDFYPEVQFFVNRIPVTLWYDYARNLGNVGTEDGAQSLGNDIHDSDEAWGIGLKVGKLKNVGDWEAFYGYYEIGANAVVAAFNDSDFGGPGTNGFTNRMGHKFGLGYQFSKNATLNWTGFYVQPLNPANSSSLIGLGSATNETVFRSQLDAVYKF